MLEIGETVHCLISGMDWMGRKKIDTVEGKVVGQTGDSYIVESPAVKGKIYYAKCGEGSSIFKLRGPADWRRDALQDELEEQERESFMHEDE